MTTSYAVERCHALTRMVLIDSYAPGRITEVPLENGLVLTGRNGRGKTTLLQILPLFHGESPSRLATRSEGRQSFARHYLPNSTSYIVFEYVREPGDHRLAVVYPYEGDKLAWRFVRASYRIEMFIDDRDHIVEGRDLMAHLARLGVKSSRQILSQAEYRNILHNTPDKGGDQRALAADFSIMPRGTRMRGVERIVSGMFARQTSFTDLQNIIVADLREGEDAVPLLANRVQAEEWVKDHGAYADVMSRRPSYEAAVQATQSMRVASAGMREAVSALQGYLEFDKLRSAQIVERRKAIADVEKAIDTDDEPRLRAINRRIGADKDELANLEQRSERHAAEKAAFNTKDVETLAHRILDIPAAEQRASLSRQGYDALKGEHREIESKNKALIGVIDIEERRALQRISDNRDATVAALSNERDLNDKMLRSEANEMTRRHEDEARSAADTQRRLAVELAIARERVAGVRADDALEEDVTQAERAVAAASAAMSAAEGRSVTARIAHVEARARHDEAARILSRADRDTADAYQALERAREFVHGRPGSLLRLLREDGRDLVGTMASLLVPEALLSQELEATRIDDGNSIYGYSLAGEKLSPHMSADPGRAAEEVRRADDAHKIAQASAAEAHREAGRMAKERQAAAREEEEASCALNISRTALDRANEVLRGAVGRRDTARAERQLRHQHEIEMGERAVEAAEAEAKAVSDRAKRERADHDHRAQTFSENLDRRHRQAMDASKSAATATRSDAQRRRVEAEAALTAALAERGVDPQALERARIDMERAEKYLAELLDARLIVEEYERWIAREALPEAQRQMRMRHLRASIPAVERERNALERDIGLRRTSLANERDALRREEDAMSAPRGLATTRLAGLVAQLGGPAIETASWSVHDNLDTILEHANKAVGEYDRARAARQRHLQTLDAAFGGHPGTQIEQFRHDVRFTGSAGGDPLKGYAAWFEQIHHETHRSMASVGRQIAQAIGEFHGQLKDFERNTRKFNSELQRHLGEATTFEGVTDLEIRVVSMVSELDYWKRIEKVSDLAAQWRKADNDDDRHEDAFVAALGSLLEMWRLSGSLRAELQQLIRIEGNVTENGQRKVFRNAAHLVAISSNGLSYLILVSIFVAFLNRIRSGAPVTITWALDELRDIDRRNTRVLTSLLRRNRIELVTAFPDPDPDIMGMFRHRFMIGEGRKLLRVKEREAHAFANDEVRTAQGDVTTGVVVALGLDGHAHHMAATSDGSEHVS